MPLPKPTNNEKQPEFIDRCMRDDESIKDFPKEKQRVAVCIDIYRRENKLDKHSNATVSDRVEKGLLKNFYYHK